MDLIYMNADREDIGVMKEFSLDLAFGADENDFECTVSRNMHCCKERYYLYIEGTEYGGVIDDIESDTDADEVKYHGRSWQGFLDIKCILPLQQGEKSENGVTLKLLDADQNSYVDRYLIVSGEANNILSWMINRVGLEGLFSASTVNSGIYVEQFQFDRYCMAYAGICKMLKSCGAKLKLDFQNGKVVLHAESIKDYSKDEQFDSDLISLKVKRYYKPVNHLICLGQGDLEERQIIHLYADEEGSISHSQSLMGTDEIVQVYDYPSVESLEELEKGGIEKLQEAWNQDHISIGLDSDQESFDIGDVVGAVDQITGMEGKAEITKKIVTINNEDITISYEVGED